MSRHYSIPERVHMETQTLLASDPVIWRAYVAAVEGQR